jgi:hypothetical protein
MFDRRGWALGVALLCLSAAAAPKKTKKPAPPPKPVPLAPAPAPTPPAECAVFAECLKALNDAFESGDAEAAQRVAARAEGFAKEPKDQAALLAVQGALDAQSLGLTPQTREAVKRRFGQAQRLDPGLTVIAIPAFARTDALEALWEEARPVIAPKPEVIVEVKEVPVEVPAPPPHRKFPVATTVLGALGVAAVGTGGAFGYLAGSTNAQAMATPGDLARYQTGQQAQQQALIANACFAGAGALALALVRWQPMLEVAQILHQIVGP